MANGIVAMVDGNPITLAQLRRRAAPHVATVKRSGLAPWAHADAIRKVWAEVLESMVDDMLLQQAAARISLTVSDKAVDEQLDRIAASMKMSRDGLLAEALVAGLNANDYREELRRQILAWRVLHFEYSRTECRPFPEGEDASRALDAYRKRWLKDRRRAACVETWLASSPR